MNHQNPEKEYLEYWERPYLKSSPYYRHWRDYELAGVERGKNFSEIISRQVSLPGKKVLDNGSGDGGISIAFAQRGAEMYALEPDKERVYRSNLRFRGYQLGVRLAQAQAENLPYLNEVFDIVIAIDMIEHVEDRSRTLREIARVLKPSGILFMTAPNRFSWKHFCSDPHFGLFGISVLPHFLAAWYVTVLRKKSKNYYVGTFPIYTRTLSHLFRLGLHVFQTNFDFLPAKKLPFKTQNEGWGKSLVTRTMSLTGMQKPVKSSHSFFYNFKPHFWLLARKKNNHC